MMDVPPLMLYEINYCMKLTLMGLPCGSVAKNTPVNALDTGLIPGQGSVHMLQDG